MQIPLAKARLIAERIVSKLAPCCEKIEIAGSIRRGRPFVSDIDIVVQVNWDFTDILMARCAEKARWIKGGKQYNVYELANGIQLDLWFAHGAVEERRDMFSVIEKAKPSNFGMLLLSRTGSALHNVYLASHAKSLGLHFQPHQGITQAGRVIASETEADIFKALKMDFVPPERRER